MRKLQILTLFFIANFEYDLNCKLKYINIQINQNLDFRRGPITRF